MATVRLQVSNVCSGGGHADVEIQVNGNVVTTLQGIYVPDFLDPITEDDAMSFVRCLIKVAKTEHTNQQIRNALLAGYTLTIT